LVIVLFMAVGVQQARAEPIQWRIEDGGNGRYYDLIMPEAVADSYTWVRA
jgi:hypothetical protein